MQGWTRRQGQVKLSFGGLSAPADGRSFPRWVARRPVRGISGGVVAFSLPQGVWCVPTDPFISMDGRRGRLRGRPFCFSRVRPSWRSEYLSAVLRQDGVGKLARRQFGSRNARGPINGHEAAPLDHLAGSREGRPNLQPKLLSSNLNRSPQIGVIRYHKGRAAVGTAPKSVDSSV